jgi:CarboxypepD_reg-like domain
MRNLVFMLAATAAMSCGSNSSTVAVGNNNPLGTVGGVVIDAASETPIMGATVSLLVGGQSLMATTDMNGVFSIAKVPSGNFIASISNMGYETASINSALNGAVGNFPIKDPVTTIGPIGLIKNDGTFTVKLVDETGAAVANIMVTAQVPVRYITYSNGYAGATGTYQVSGMSGTDGTVTLSGLPEYATLSGIVNDFLTIYVPPTQVMGAMGVYSFLGGQFTFEVNNLANSNNNAGPGQNTPVDEVTIKLAGPSTVLQILGSNVDLLRNLTVTGSSAAPTYSSIGVIPFIAPTGPITIEFNQVINKSTVRAQLFNEDGTTAGQMMATGSDNQLSISPMSALTAGARYNMALHVDAEAVPGQQSAGRELNVVVPLFIQPASGTMVKISTINPPKSSQATPTSAFFVTFSFNEPVGFGFGSAAGIPCVSYLDVPGTLGLDANEMTLINGVLTTDYPGEWPMGSSTGAGVTCAALGALDVTRITPLEAAPGMPITGFASKWQMEIDDGAGHSECKYPADPVKCPMPSPYPTVHLLPSHAGGGFTLKLPDGTPIPDNVTNLSFAVPGP